MWEHGMPGCAWSMALELARWDELGDNAESAAAMSLPEETPTSQTVRGLPRMRLPGWQRRTGTVAVQ
jgi:hypothetical protein